MSDDAVPAPGSHTDDHDDLAVAWALGALDPDAERDFAAHLATCPVCRRTVDETLEVIGDVGPVDPTPPGVLPDVMADGVADGAANAPGGDVPPTSWASPPRSLRDEREPPAPAPLPRRAGDATAAPPHHRRAPRWVAVAVAVAVIVGVIVLILATAS